MIYLMHQQDIQFDVTNQDFQQFDNSAVELKIDVTAETT